MQTLIESPDVQRALIAHALNEDHLVVAAMLAKIDKLTVDVAALTDLVKQADIPKLNEDVGKLMELFKGAKGVVWIVTRLGGLAAVVTALVHLLAPYITWNSHK